MKRRSRTYVIAAGVITCLTATALFAQSEKISIRMAPRPQQTVRMTMTQEMDFEMTFDGAALPGVTGPMKMLMRITMAVTQKTGPLKADGTVDAELNFDQVRAEISMNGQPMPSGDANPFAGKPVVVTYNRNGEVVGVTDLPGAGLTGEVFKQMIGSFSGNLPVTALGVGETTTAPLDFTLPLPLPGAAAMKMVGQTRLTLVSIDKDAQGRSARFDSTAGGNMVSDLPSPDGKSKMTLDFTMVGEGTMVMDLDRGVMRSNQSTSTFTGKMDMPAGAAPGASPSMNMRGIVKVTMTSN